MRVNNPGRAPVRPAKSIGRRNMTTEDPLKLISNAFNKLHEQLSIVRTHVEEMEDPVAWKLVESMELGLFAPMRKLRIHLDIPYDWHSKNQKSKETEE
jgi:hypothetical protein